MTHFYAILICCVFSYAAATIAINNKFYSLFSVLLCNYFYCQLPVFLPIFPSFFLLCFNIYFFVAENQVEWKLCCDVIPPHNEQNYPEIAVKLFTQKTLLITILSDFNAI